MSASTYLVSDLTKPALSNAPDILRVLGTTTASGNLCFLQTTLVAGVSPAVACANISSSSVVLITGTSAAVAGTLSCAITPVAGAGSFVISSTNTADVPTLTYLVIG
jgi:CHASE2 domain-containing sensor protein